MKLGENAKIATAHSLSDCAETYIFNSSRGASLSGICGIPPVRGKIIRPLIDFSREQIEAYADEHGIGYVTDSTNLTDEYTRNKIRHGVIPVMKEINPKDTTRAYAFEMWMNAPMPMVTFFKTLDVSNLVKISRKKRLKFNMLMCYCIGRAASQVKEFYLLPVGDKLMQYDTIAVNTIVANSAGEVSSCDLPFNEDLGQFGSDYLRLTQQVAESCTDHDLSAGSMVIGTSALAQYELDGAVGMYSGIFNNPFMIWGKYKRGLFKTTLTVSFQFHHTQMDGAHAALFLSCLQAEIDSL